MAATINGQPVRLVFNTVGADSALFRTAAERLKLRLTEPAADVKPAPGFMRAATTEPLDFAIGTVSGRARFLVVDPPSLGKSLPEEDGLLSWYGLRNNVFVFDASNLSFAVGDQVPRDATSWPRFPQRAEALALGFEVGGEGPRHGVVYVVTGDDRGVALGPALWEKWVAAHADQPATMVVSMGLTGRVTVRKEMWASEIAIGSLVLTDVPVREMDVEEPSFAVLTDGVATLGLYALRRLDFVMDGTNRVVYARARGGPVPAYPHNQLGAAFAPKDAQGEVLLAHVAPASPAYLAGIRDEDVLLKIDDLDATQWRSEPRFLRVLRTLLWERPPGSTYRLTLKRGEREYQASVVLKHLLGPEERTGGDLAAQPGVAGTTSLAEIRARAEQGNAVAQSALGSVFLVGGLGVAKDEAEAARWFRQAAEQNHREAQYRLSTCYHEQLGVAKDDAEAYKWSLLAAAQGDESAKRLMSQLAEQLPPKQIFEGQKWARNFKPRAVPLVKNLSPDTPFLPTR